jgi:hypothetical protein
MQPLFFFFFLQLIRSQWAHIHSLSLRLDSTMSFVQQIEQSHHLSQSPHVATKSLQATNNMAVPGSVSLRSNELTTASTDDFENEVGGNWFVLEDSNSKQAEPSLSMQSEVASQEEGLSQGDLFS